MSEYERMGQPTETPTGPTPMNAKPPAFAASLPTPAHTGADAQERRQAYWLS